MKKAEKKKRMKFLRKELKDFEKKTAMTQEEREALRNWVENGHSVYENEYSWFHGTPMDYLTEYRFRHDWETTELPFEEMKDAGEKDPEPAAEPCVRQEALDTQYTSDTITLEKLKGLSVRLYKVSQLLWEVLLINGLRDDACEYLEECSDDELPLNPFELIFDSEDPV